MGEKLHKVRMRYLLALRMNKEIKPTFDIWFQIDRELDGNELIFLASRAQNSSGISQIGNNKMISLKILNGTLVDMTIMLVNTLLLLRILHCSYRVSVSYLLNHGYCS